MQPQNLDESVRFACGSCTFCCDQPWHTLIEADKAQALDRHDFSAYPHLVGRDLYDKGTCEKEGFHRLAKGEGTRCLFLDADDLCIIHKELGPEAKPHMCRQFPYLAAHTWVDDRVSANYGCPSVQAQDGPPLSDHVSEMASRVPRTQRDPKPDAPVPLDKTCALTPAENDALFDRAVSLFDPEHDADVWGRFAELLALLVGVREYKTAATRSDNGQPDALVDLLRSGQALPDAPDVPEIRGYPQPGQSPMQARFLFAATLYPDTVPPDAVTAMGLFKRLTLIPKLMALATLSGTYASRLFGRNIPIDQVMAHQVDEDLDAAATQLLVRYFRSRLWQRYLAGTRLTVTAGIHQHIHDLNAIVFLARAEAQHTSASRLTEPIIRNALPGVEFHLANQARLFNQTLKGWFRTQLQRPELALASLRLMALRPAHEPVDAS